MNRITLSTTNVIEGKPAKNYLGIVTGETIIGANIFKDLFASIRDIVGGRSGSYEKVLREAKDTALKEMEEAAIRLGRVQLLALILIMRQ